MVIDMDKIPTTMGIKIIENTIEYYRKVGIALSFSMLCSHIELKTTDKQRIRNNINTTNQIKMAIKMLDIIKDWERKDF